VIGWLPFLSQDKAELHKQICEEQLNLKIIKKLRNSTIKCEYKKQLN
jgi:hypothetical protein